MHIPDGFLSTPVWAGSAVAAAPALGYCLRRTQSCFETSRTPLLGVMGAFIFAAQMIHFPLGVGTSGHLTGAALLAATLGPSAATVVMTAILVVQALVFQDGGVLALGANGVEPCGCGRLGCVPAVEMVSQSECRHSSCRSLSGRLDVFDGGGIVSIG